MAKRYGHAARSNVDEESVRVSESHEDFRRGRTNSLEHQYRSSSKVKRCATRATEIPEKSSSSKRKNLGINSSSAPKLTLRAC